MKYPTTSIHWALLCPFIFSCVVASADDPTSVDELEKKVRQLQKERVEVLAQCAKFVQQQYNGGLTDVSRLMDVQQPLLDARLELAESAAEEMTVLEEQLKAAQDVYQIAQKKGEAGAVTQLDVVQARAHALSVEIRLMKHRRAASAKDAAELDRKARDLQEERLGVCTSCVKIAEGHYNAGLSDYRPAMKAQTEWFQAALDQADTGEERLAILRQQQKIVKGSLQIVEAKAAAGAVTRLDVLQAKASLLQVEIQLAETRDASEPGGTVRELREKQTTVLSEAFRHADTQYRGGFAGPQAVLDAQLQLLEARSEVAETPTQKRAILEEQLKTARMVTKIAEAKVNAGAVTSLDALLAKSHALRVEIELLKVQRAALRKSK